MKDYTYKKKTKTLDEEGNVKMKEKANFYTNPAKKGRMRATPGIMFGNFKWEKDEYGRAEAWRKKRAKREKAKIKHERAFLNMHYGQLPLNSDRKVLFTDPK